MKSKNFQKEDYFFFSILLIFGILLFFLFKFQIIEGKKFKEIAGKNYFRIAKKTTKRGIIYDKNFQPLVENVPLLAVYIDIGKIKDKEKLAQFLSENLSLSKEKIVKIIYENRFRKFAPILVDSNIELETAIKLSEMISKFPSILVKAESGRNYILESHFLGYVGKISRKEYNSRKDKGYARTDYIGKVGLEKFYEAELKGKKGYDVIQVDAAGNSFGLMKNISGKQSIAGKNLVLTIDAELQKLAEKLLPSDKASALVAMNCKTGGIIASASKPKYNPNKFVSGMNQKYWQSIVENKDKPLLDKTYNATYPPGSIFKLLVAAYVLENKLVNPDEELVDCKGGVEYGGRFYGCWKKEGHGKMNLLDAIRESCDTYFYKLAEMINLDDFKKFVDIFGLTEKTGVDIMNERAGFFPTSDWYDKNYSKFGWTRGHLLNLMIGQGEVLVTPLSMACFYSAIANGGILHKPHFVDYFYVDGKKEKIENEKTQIPIKRETLEFLMKSLDAAVNEKRRTGGMARVTNIKVGGKTGSAENYKGDTHAWFSAVAPIDNPEIVVIVFIENGGSGADAAAPLAGKIIAHYFGEEPILLY